MHVHVTVELDGDDLVVVKTASGGEGAARLRTEARRLRRLTHPGVVELLDAGPLAPADADERQSPAGVRAEDAGEGYRLRLAHAGEPLTQWRASAVHVAAVAAVTASTLADLHDLGVVHGRLDASHVLVGDDGRPRLCGFGDPGDATAEDDVAAWGRLVADLLGRTPHDARGWRGAVAGRRTRAVRRELERLCHHADDPVPGRRPTARAAADAVVAAVPEARLPASPAATHRYDGDTLDRIWSYDGEPTEAERWAAAFGTAPEATYAPPGDLDRPPTELPLALAAPPTWDDRPTEDDAVAMEEPLPAEDMPPDAGDDAAVVVDDRHRPGHASARTARTVASGDGDDRDRPLRQAPLTLAATAIAAVVVLGGTLVATRVVRDAGTPPPPAAAGEACPPAAAPAADVDGDGCREALTVDGSTVDAGVARWTLGEPGDVVALGDWDCDGEATAAVLRPSTGDVFHFPAWAATGDKVTVAPVDRVQGATSLRRADTSDACDRLVAARPDGRATDVTMAP